MKKHNISVIDKSDLFQATLGRTKDLWNERGRRPRIALFMEVEKKMALLYTYMYIYLCVSKSRVTSHNQNTTKME